MPSSGNSTLSGLEIDSSRPSTSSSSRFAFAAMDWTYPGFAPDDLDHRTQRQRAVDVREPCPVGGGLVDHLGVEAPGVQGDHDHVVAGRRRSDRGPLHLLGVGAVDEPLLGQRAVAGGLDGEAVGLEPVPVLEGHDVVEVAHRLQPRRYWSAAAPRASAKPSTRLGHDLGHRQDAVDAPGHLSRHRDRRLHVPAEVEVGG